MGFIGHSKVFRELPSTLQRHPACAPAAHVRNVFMTIIHRIQERFRIRTGHAWQAPARECVGDCVG
jgi:hypothetical protein